MILAKTDIKKIPDLCTECKFHKVLGCLWIFCEIKKDTTPYGNIRPDDWCPLIKVNANRLK